MGSKNKSINQSLPIMLKIGSCFELIIIDTKYQLINVNYYKNNPIRK